MKEGNHKARPVSKHQNKKNFIPCFWWERETIKKKSFKLFMPRIKCLLMIPLVRTFIWFFFSLIWYWLVKARTNRIDTQTDTLTHATQNQRFRSFTVPCLCIPSLYQLFQLDYCRRLREVRGDLERALNEVSKLPVTMLISSSWLRWLDELSDKLELAELNGWSDGQGDGGPPLFINLENVW